jgi:hypothetical protein
MAAVTVLAGVLVRARGGGTVRDGRRASHIGREEVTGGV